MAIYLGETRAATNAVAAAIERFLGWVLFGPRQHADDLRLATVQLQRGSRSESRRETARTP